MSQLVTRKTRSRRTSLDMEGSQISEERQISGGVKSCSVNVRSMKENPDSRVITEKQNALVIDDIIDDFDLEDELKEESVMDSENGDITETHFNGVKSSEQDSEEGEIREIIDDNKEFLGRFYNGLKFYLSSTLRITVFVCSLGQYIYKIHTFKINMWVHLNHGDLGLIEFIKRLCHC